jgi:hypothetical protein
VAASLAGSAAILGERALHADAAPAGAYPPADAPAALGHFRGAAVAVSGVPEQASLSDVETLFAGYALAPDPVRALRRVDASARRATAAGVGARGGGPSAAPERRTIVVRFASALEAHCAARDKHRHFIGAQAVDVKLLQ